MWRVKPAREGLIDNGLDEDAAKLHDDLGELLGIPVAKREQVRCTAKWFVSGGRVTRQCRENADPANVCAECGEARCDEHESDLGFEDRNGRVLCSECAAALSANETLETLTPEYMAWLDSQGLPHESAEDLLCRTNLTDAQRTYLSQFIQRWESRRTEAGAMKKPRCYALNLARGMCIDGLVLR